MEKARIAVFEDSAQFRTMLSHAVNMSEHTIIGEAANLNDADALIEEQEFDAAVVDGNLDSFSVECSDGKAIIARLKEKRSSAKIIWFSTMSAEAVDAQCDVDVGKDPFGAIEAIDRL